MTKPAKEPGLIDIIQEEILETAPFFGIHPQIAEDHAKAVIDKLRLRLGGSECYMAKHERTRRDAEIQAKWRGNNLDKLSKEYHLHPRHLRRIIERMQKMEKSSA